MYYTRLLENIILPVGDKILGTNFMNELRKWRVISAFSRDHLQRLQGENLRHLLEHSVRFIPYYKSLNIALSGNPYEDIRRFPFLTKPILRQEVDNLHQRLANSLVVEKTSGSSGEQGEVYMSKKERSQVQAAQVFLWEWSGYKLGEKLLQTGMTLKRGIVKSCKDSLLRTQYLSAYDLSDEKLTRYLQKAKKDGCDFLGGYAASLNSLAKVAIDKQIDVKFKSVISWGDKLFEQYKKNIHQAFGNPFITELYGATEGFVISGTCENGNHHILTPHVYVELLDKNGNETRVGDWGYVVVTRLDAYNFPLIRYYLGDLAIKAGDDERCTCGRNFPLLKKIIGRDTDLVQTPAGKDLIVHFFTGIFEHFAGIAQFRVIQKEPGKIEIEYIPSPSFSPQVLLQIEQNMYSKANESFPVCWRRVEEIGPTQSGKPQIVQNLIREKPHIANPKS